MEDASVISVCNESIIVLRSDEDILVHSKEFNIFIVLLPSLLINVVVDEINAKLSDKDKTAADMFVITVTILILPKNTQHIAATAHVKTK